jgi:hypothetical protein
MRYPWYDTVDDSATIEQGDIIEGCNVIIPDASRYRDVISGTTDGGEVSVETINCIVMSQSCDIQHSKIDSIIVCPIWALRNFVESNEHFKSSKAREELRRGKYPAYHLLNTIETDTLPPDFYVVDFHHIYSVPKDFVLMSIEGKSHKRLLPPYREHLSQSFARYFMRVGLPTDINEEELKSYRK